jgi:hypothetical protein
MGMMGQGVLAIWAGIRPEGEADYRQWHSLQHLPERLSVPGFRRGRRGVAVGGPPGPVEYLMMYEVDAPPVLVSQPYLARLNDPTDWTRRSFGSFVGMSRTACRVAVSHGRGVGGWLAAVRLPDDAPAAATDALADPALCAGLMEGPGIVGAHAIVSARELGPPPVTEERRVLERVGSIGRPVAGALLVDGIDDASVARAARDAAARLGAGATATLFQMQHVMVAAEAA